VVDSEQKRMKGLEPSTFCMATRPDRFRLKQQLHGGAKSLR